MEKRVFLQKFLEVDRTTIFLKSGNMGKQKKGELMQDYKPISMWYCDVCNEAIEKISNGIVTWDCEEKNGKYFKNDIKIRHKKSDPIHKNCDNNVTDCWCQLEDLLGEQGQSELLFWLSSGSIEDYFTFSEDFKQNITKKLGFILKKKK